MQKVHFSTTPAGRGDGPAAETLKTHRGHSLFRRGRSPKLAATPPLSLLPKRHASNRYADGLLLGAGRAEGSGRGRPTRVRAYNRRAMLGHTVREAGTADVGPAAELCKASLADAYGHFLSEDAMRPWIEGGKTDAFVREHLAGMLVVEREDTVVGVCIVTNDLIDLLWVGAGARGAGVGRSLIEAAESRVRQGGARSIRVECFAQNKTALEFYGRMGYAVAKTIRDPEAEVMKHELRKPLSPESE